MITSGQQNVVKFTHIISKEGEHNKCHVNYVFWKVFKNSKTVYESISCNVADFLYLKSTKKEIEHSNGTLRALGHSKSTWALGHSKGNWALTQALEALSLADANKKCHMIFYSAENILSQTQTLQSYKHFLDKNQHYKRFNLYPSNAKKKKICIIKETVAWFYFIFSPLF